MILCLYANHTKLKVKKQFKKNNDLGTNWIHTESGEQWNCPNCRNCGWRTTENVIQKVANQKARLDGFRWGWSPTEDVKEGTRRRTRYDRCPKTNVRASQSKMSYWTTEAGRRRDADDGAHNAHCICNNQT